MKTSPWSPCVVRIHVEASVEFAFCARQQHCVCRIVKRTHRRHVMPSIQNKSKSQLARHTEPQQSQLPKAGSEVDTRGYFRPDALSPTSLGPLNPGIPHHIVAFSLLSADCRRATVWAFQGVRVDHATSIRASMQVLFCSDVPECEARALECEGKLVGS